jgi:RNA polymerase sigma-70 factor (ECF subfamily)
LTKADAEDLTQEIFLALFQNVANFRGEAQLSTWVHRVALNHCLKWQQKHARQPTFEPQDEIETMCFDARGQPATQFARLELREHLSCALEKLSPAHREIVILHELQQLTYAQCAQVLDVPIGTVKSRLFNAFRQLRSTLEPYLLVDENPNEGGQK